MTNVHDRALDLLNQLEAALETMTSRRGPTRQAHTVRDVAGHHLAAFRHLILHHEAYSDPTAALRRMQTDLAETRQKIDDDITERILDGTITLPPLSDFQERINHLAENMAAAADGSIPYHFVAGATSAEVFEAWQAPRRAALHAAAEQYRPGIEEAFRKAIGLISGNDNPGQTLDDVTPPESSSPE